MEPPPSWWVLTYLNHTRSWHELYVCAFTNFPDHLWMAWSYTKPRRQGIWRLVRGKQVFCGYKYTWDTPTIVEQNRPGDTDDHIWLLQRLRSDRHIWYYLFAPLGPYGLEIQGPLMHVPPPEAHLWTSTVLVGTKLKGIYHTDTFSGPGGDHPVWLPSNDGLHDLRIWQLHAEPLGLQYRQYALAGAPGARRLYERIPPVSPTWKLILPNALACTLTGSGSGELCWLATNIYFPGHLYVLFNSRLTTNGTWCLRSTDYGFSWHAFQIYSDIFNYEAGNIVAGLTQGSSPFDPGTVLYAALNTTAGGGFSTYRSTDLGESWVLANTIGSGAATPHCHVDPTDQATVYTSAYLGAGQTHELHRSTEHGNNMLEVDGTHHLGFFIDAFLGNMSISPTDSDFVNVLQDDLFWATQDYCLTWENWGLLDNPAERLAILWENPSRLYLGRAISGTFPPLGPLNHVIFVSDTHGIYMEGKAGEHPYFSDGGADSIPYNCGGICNQGMMLAPPY